MSSRRRILMLLMTLATIAGAGVALGSIVAKPLNAEQTCSHRACNTNNNNCFDSDVPYNCHGAGITGICNSYAC